MNIDLEVLRNKQEEHNFFQHYPGLPPNLVHKDRSCDQCYPTAQAPEIWDRFWLWYIPQGAQSYSGKTQEYFNKAQNTTNPDKRKQWIYRLICATRFYALPDSAEILSRDIEHQILNNFEELDTEQPHTKDFYFFSSPGSQTTPEPVSQAESVVQSDQEESLDQDLPEDPLDFLYDIPQLFYHNYQFDQAFNLPDLDQALNLLFNPMAQGMDQLQANLAATLTALNNTLTRSHVIPLSTFHGGSHEDPVKWYEEVERISQSNAYDAAYKQRVIGAFLKDGAASWFDGVRGNIQSWDQQNDVNSFKAMFMNQYRTQNKIV